MEKIRDLDSLEEFFWLVETGQSVLPVIDAELVGSTSVKNWRDLMIGQVTSASCRTSSRGSVIVSPDDVFCVDEAWLSTSSAKKRSAQRVPEPANDDSGRERQNIEALLAESGGRVYGTNGTAARLRIPPSTLDSKIKKLQIRKSHFKHY